MVVLAQFWRQFGASRKLVDNIQQKPAYKNLWIKSPLVEIYHLTTPKKTRSSGFSSKGYSYIMINILTNEFEF